MLLPFGLISIPIILWCLANWSIARPQSQSVSVVTEEAADAVPLPQEEASG
jgi:hypothetical protein